MNKRPLPVTIISCVLAGISAVGLGYHLVEFKAHPDQHDIVLVSVVRILGIISGVFMLRGSNWARWLAIVWIAFHVGVSYFHAWPELLIHVLLFVAFAYFLFCAKATKYFRGAE
jgi:hypothetical protein